MRNFRLILAKCFQGQLKRGVERTGDLLLPKLNFFYKTTSIYANQFSSSNGFHSVHKHVEKALNYNEFPIVIGGDHSVSSASVQAVVDKHPDVQVYWIDAHADINTPETTQTGNKHGMPMASLLGLMKPVIKPKNMLSPEQVTYIGLRDVDSYEEEFLEKLNIKQYRMNHFNSINNMIKEIREKNENKKIHISLDIDALDPEFAPSTGTPVENGMTPNQLNCVLEELFPQTISMDLVEINPLLGSRQDVKKTLNIGANILNKLSNY
jgi:arginase